MNIENRLRKSVTVDDSSGFHYVWRYDRNLYVLQNGGLVRREACNWGSCDILGDYYFPLTGK